ILQRLGSTPPGTAGSRSRVPRAEKRRWRASSWPRNNTPLGSAKCRTWAFREMRRSRPLHMMRLRESGQFWLAPAATWRSRILAFLARDEARGVRLQIKTLVYLDAFVREHGDSCHGLLPKALAHEVAQQFLEGIRGVAREQHSGMVTPLSAEMFNV